MITAEELLKDRVYITIDDIEDVHDSLSNVTEAMIEFAKLHVEEALKEASEKVTTDGYGDGYAGIDEESILNAYPLENIK